MITPFLDLAGLSRLFIRHFFLKCIEHIGLPQLFVSLPGLPHVHVQHQVMNHASSAFSERIAGTTLDQAFDHPLINLTEVHLFTQLLERVEPAQLLAGFNNLIDSRRTNIFDSSESEQQ